MFDDPGDPATVGIRHSALKLVRRIYPSVRDASATFSQGTDGATPLAEGPPEIGAAVMSLFWYTTVLNPCASVCWSTRCVLSRQLQDLQGHQTSFTRIIFTTTGQPHSAGVLRFALRLSGTARLRVRSASTCSLRPRLRMRTTVPFAAISLLALCLRNCRDNCLLTAADKAAEYDI